MTEKTLHPMQWDIRVRERNLKAGLISDKDVEKHKAALADVADQAETIVTPQPAVANPAEDEDEDEDDAP